MLSKTSGCPQNGQPKASPGLPGEIFGDAKTKALVDSKWKALAKELGVE
jgi:hypothetical protein